VVGNYKFVSSYLTFEKSKLELDEYIKHPILLGDQRKWYGQYLGGNVVGDIGQPQCHKYTKNKT